MDTLEYTAAPGTTGAVDSVARAAASTAQSTANGAVSTNTTQDSSISANASAITALTARLDNRDQKDSVRALATTDITLSGTQTVDGVALGNGDRVGVIGQTLGAANGIYVVGTPWTRATDADTSAKVTNGMFFFVEEGTVNKGLAYELTTANPIVLGTTVLVFAHFAGTLKSSEITNDSSVSGTTSKDALNTLLSADSTESAARIAADALKADLTQTTTTTAATSYTIQASDNGKELLFTAATTVTVTIPDTIVPGSNLAFNCTLVQEGAGQLSFTVSGTQVIKKPAAFLSKSREQESAVGLKIYSATKCRLSGDLAFV